MKFQIPNKSQYPNGKNFLPTLSALPRLRRNKKASAGKQTIRFDHWVLEFPATLKHLGGSAWI